MLSSTLKHLFIRLLLLILWSGGMLLLTQCNKDEAPLESYRSELLMVHTTSHGDIDKLLTDEGQVLHPTNILQGVRPDTTYRALATFRYVTDSKRVELRQVVLIPTALPIRIKEEAMRTAPIQLLSLWKTPNYINLRFGIPKSFKGNHIIGWSFRGISSTHNGHRKLHLQLYHDDHADRSDYFEETYLSCPIQQFSQWLVPGVDSIALNINTVKGQYQAVFPY